MITFKVSVNPKEMYAVVEFELQRNLEPKDLLEIVPPDPVKEGFSDKVVVLSGRGPIWLYAYLTHYYHPVKAIGIYDPRLGGAVIVQSHVNYLKVGDLLHL